MYRLNLAVASRIYLLEPQWNPSIESQAIGRALRLGQTAQVVVVRYIMNETVEQVQNAHPAIFQYKLTGHRVMSCLGKERSSSLRAVDSKMRLLKDLNP